MSTILNAAPKAILQGVKDESGGTLPVVPEQIPTHLPHIFLFTEKGPLEPQLVSGGSATRMFGAKSFDLRSKYANHQTVLANVVNGNGNAMVVQRLKPDDAKAPATLALGLEVVADELPVYERESDDSLSLDQSGEPIATADTTPGHKMRWVLREVPDGAIGGGASMAGSMTGAADQQSTIYPIVDLQVSDFGSHGNLKGIRLWAPTTASASSPASEEVIYDQNTFLYRIQMIQRPDSKTQPNVIETVAGSQSIEFSFKEGAINTRVDSELFIEQVLLDAYRDLDIQPKQFGPFNDLHVYHDNLQTVLDMVYAGEQAFQPDWPTDVEEGRHLVNLVGGKSVSGAHYHTIQVLGKSEGGIELTPNSNHYANGGSDGTIDNVTFDALVANQAANYGDLEYSFMDSAMWPQSIIYDTGFTLETKKKLLTPIGRRKDMMIVLSTQDVTSPGFRQNTAEEESSVAIALRASARLYPESEVFGTPVCRALVVGHSGHLLNSQYKSLMPLTIELADKMSRFMGAGNGIWSRDRGFDTAPYNQINMFKDVNCTYKPQNVYDKDWDSGLVWVQNFDRRSLFFPAVQTVYDDSTSVLNSAINAMIIVEIEKVAERSWRELTGTSKLTRGQFIERSNTLISEKTQGRFDDRVIVVPNTYFTDFDQALGYSWSCDIELYLNNMMTVGTYTIVARRRSDFAG
jgi:hypothetical protein